MEFTFQSFINGMTSNPMFLITVLLTLGVIFVNGWTDAPNAIATCVTTRCLSVRKSILMSAFFNFLGVFIMTMINSSVASTISNMVDFGDNAQNATIALCAALFSIVVYSVGASYFGIPTSESHSLIAGITGSAIAVQGFEGINMGEWAKVLIGLDFFAASINRVAAWVIGARNMQKALLSALLMPHAKLAEYQNTANYTKQLALTEELKTFPFGLVFDEYCEKCNVPTGTDWFRDIDVYESDVLSKRG